MRVVDELKRFSLVSHINKEYPQENSGESLSLLCPFHDDSTKSLVVYPGNFYCFACGAHGDIIDWEMRTKSWSFREAVNYLADKYKLSTGGGLGAPPITLFERYRNAAAKIAVSDLVGLLLLRPGAVPDNIGVTIHHVYGERDHLRVIRDLLGLPDSREGRATAIEILERAAEFYRKKTRNGKTRWTGGLHEL